MTERSPSDRAGDLPGTYIRAEKAAPVVLEFFSEYVRRDFGEIKFSPRMWTIGGDEAEAATRGIMACLTAAAASGPDYYGMAAYRAPGANMSDGVQEYCLLLGSSVTSDPAVVEALAAGLVRTTNEWLAQLQSPLRLSGV